MRSIHELDQSIRRQAESRFCSPHSVETFQVTWYPLTIALIDSSIQFSFLHTSRLQECLATLYSPTGITVDDSSIMETVDEPSTITLYLLLRRLHSICLPLRLRLRCLLCHHHAHSGAIHGVPKVANITPTDISSRMNFLFE